MKKIIAGLSLLLASVAVISCDSDNNPNEDKFNDTPDTGYIAFETPGDTLSITSLAAACSTAATADTLEVPVVLRSIIGNYYPFPNTPSNENGFEVNYTITDVVGNSSGVNISLDFPARTDEGVLSVIVPQSLTNDLEFKVTLTGTSNSNVTVQTEGVTVAQEVYIRVNRSEKAALYGTYDGVQTSGTTNTPYAVNVTPGSSANEIILSNVFNQEEINGPTATKVIVNDDGTLSFPPFAENLLYTSSTASIGNVFVEGLSGTYNACEGTINMTFRLRRGPAQSPTATNSLVLTRR